MNITSLGFILWLALALTVFYCFPVKNRWIVLVPLSFLFVFSTSTFGFTVILLTSFTVYLSAKGIHSATGVFKKHLFTLSVAICFGILIGLKYLSSLPVFHRNLSLWNQTTSIHDFVHTYLIPIGLSYYTLELVSYLVDVFWGRIQPENNYFKVLLFTCYFPKMLQGPICNYSELAPVLFKEHPFQWKNIKFGVQIMLWGYCKKMILADTIEKVVDSIFSGTATPYGVTVLIGLFCYGIQLYCDFSGGIDIIRGVSQMFDVGIKDNFRQPFFSCSLGEFWRRWHISLGQWAKDYLFYPIAMSRSMRRLKKRLKKRFPRRTISRISMAISNLIVFFFIGLWHGLGTNFLAWGLYNGVILAFSALMEDVYSKWKHQLQISEISSKWYAFRLTRTLAIVTFGWVFDCACTAAGAGILFLQMLQVWKTNLFLVPFGTLMKVFPFVLILVFVDILHEKGVSVREFFSRRSYGIQLLFWTFVLQVLFFVGRHLTIGGFMYANF